VNTVCLDTSAIFMICATVDSCCAINRTEERQLDVGVGAN
jgi:hypothetical protein